MMTLLTASLLCMAAQTAPVPVILDTDIGDDIDDTWALCMLLGTPELDLKLVVTAFHDTPRKTRLVAKILDSVGRTDIPIGLGVRTAERPLHQEAWLGDYSLNGYPGDFRADGVQAMIDIIKASPEKVTLCVIGAHTNIAEALRRDPSIAENARIVSMAGSVYRGYNGKVTPDPEWNVVCDVPAIRAVFAAPWDIAIAPLDTCGILQLSGERYARVAQSQAVRAKTVIENYTLWANRKHYGDNESSVLFDAQAVYMCHSEACLDMQTVKLSIDEKGNTVPDEQNGRPVRCALNWKDRDIFEEALVRSLTGD